MRILILLLISFSSYGQALSILGLTRQRESGVPSGPLVQALVNDHDASMVYSIPWTAGTKPGMLNNDFYYSTTTNAYGEYTCANCVKLDMHSEKFPSHGIAGVSIDGGAETMVDMYEADSVGHEHDVRLLFTSGLLPVGNHTIRVRVTGTKNPLNVTANAFVVLDYFAIYYNGTAPPPEESSYDYVVDQADGGASDSGPCDAATPCLTINRAGQIAVPGDTILVKDGTYRETITPANSGTTLNPIVFLAESHNTIISGANTVGTSWTVHSGNIYKTTIDLGEPLFDEFMAGFNNENFNYNNNEILAQQIFKGGDMMFLAQYPKISTPEDYLERASMIGRHNTTSFTQTAINDDPLDDFGDLTGAYVWVNGWFLTYTRPITSHPSAGTTINFSSTDGNISFSKFYRVFGKLNLLTAAKEWFWDDPTNTLYFWQSGGGSPTGVEYKQRNWGFDLRGKANIKIDGFRFFACDPVVSDAASVNTLVNNIRVKYANHTVLESKAGADGYHDSAVQTGTKLFGAGSKIQNSEFLYAAGMSVWMGSNTEVNNCKFSDGGYNGQYSGFIKPTWGAGDIKIMHSSFARSGRGAIELSPENAASNLSLEIGYNDFSVFNMLNVDGGPIYGARKVNLTGSRIHHNWFHNDGGYDEAGVGTQAGIQVNGVYFDQASGPATIDHNVFWNGMVNGGDIYNQITYDGRTTTGTLIYNNTFASKNTGTAFSYVTYITNPNDVQRNNIYRMNILINWGADPGDIANSTLYGTNPLFVGGDPVTNSTTPIANPQSYFQLQSGSPSRGGGLAIPGINDGDLAPLDKGAYYYGGTAWIPGYVAVP